MSFNKNSKLYRQNFEKTSNKEYYFISQNIYLKELLEINNKFLDPKTDFNALEYDILQIMKKFNIYSNKDKFNIYLTLKNLLSYTRLYLNGGSGGGGEQVKSNGYTLEKININKNVSIKSEYIRYIEIFGLPESGEFYDSLLYLLRNNLV